MLLEIVERFQRRLQVARAGEIAGNVARRRLQALGFVSQEWSQKPQQRTPMLHLAAKFMHRDRIGIVGALDSAARIGQYLARDVAQGFANRQIRAQGRLLTHMTIL